MSKTSSSDKNSKPSAGPGAPEIYTIPSYQSFLDTAAAGILDQAGNDPLKLADFTILVPDRETGFALRQAFMAQLEGKPHIMPQIEAPGDMDDEQLSLRIANNAMLSQALMDIPPAVPRLHRQLLLASEILKIPGMASSPQKAIKLGGELGKFLDEAQRHDVDLKNIERLVPPEFGDQWSKTAEFLKIITKTWPEKLQEMGKVDPEEHKNVFIQILAAHWQQHKPAHPVIALGFNDNSPAVSALLQSVASLPQGKVVFQGLDLGLDKQSWDILTPVHPQYAMKDMLASIGVDRAAVKEWQAQPRVSDSFARAPNLAHTNQERQKLLREAMRPAGTAEGWAAIMAPKPVKPSSTSKTNASGGIDVQALNGMDLITCTSQQQEASVIALKMRESLEVQGRRVTLVTADRSLARRVSARLRSWEIDVRDDAGLPLSETPVGVYLQTTAAMAAEEWAPVPMLEALRHPLAALGSERDDFNRKVSDLENMVFHGTRPAPGAAGMKGALTAAFNRAARYPRPGQTPVQLQESKKELSGLIADMQKSGKNFFDKMALSTPVPFRDLLDEHIRFAEKLACDDKNTGAERIWRGEDGVKAAHFLSSLREAAAFVPDMTGREYADVLHGLMQDVTVRSAVTSHPALRITTPSHARLLKSDIVILGGVNDNVWPQGVHENPWLSPDMIKALGLPAPEASIGNAAHSFVQMASNPNVLLTRSLRSGDAPTVASPFLARMMMVLRGAGLEKNIEKKTRLLDIHVKMHTPAQVTPVEPPAPTPPVANRPKQLPVTAVETLMRDPYSVYVKYVLNIRQKAPLDASPSVAERGTLTHEALDTFMKRYPDELPPNAEAELIKIGQKVFKHRMNNPSVRAFWWPRYERIAKWFVAFEAQRREVSKVLGTEVQGKLEFDIGDGGTFTLTAIADRIDRDANDQLMMIDYKTGSVPMQKAVALGFSPQLTLEALIAFTGGFDGVDAEDVGKLQYWKLSGGREAANVTDVKGDVGELVTEARQGIEALIKAFNDQATPYLVSPRPDWAPRYNNVRHLSRVDEWSAVKKTAGKRTSTPHKRRAK
jgi:ATP-dependent helicase/nuclease subunit B